MDYRHSSSDALDQMVKDSDTDGLDISSLAESGTTQTFETVRGRPGYDRSLVESEADIILIAHPENQRLGSRFRLSPGTMLEVGRSPAVGISLPEVKSISRKHACLRYSGSVVTLEDLGSTNGTYINGNPIQGRAVLKSGDRFQTAAVHFKFLHEQDVESAYHLAIYELVARDGLTEIFNKRKYDEEAQREFARAVRHGRPLSLILFDLDEFKTINDTYGHLCGDFVLKRVASVARELTRPEDVLARIGGDEFGILVPETAISGAEALAVKLHDRYLGLDHRYGDLKIAIHCSFGVAELKPGMTLPQDLFQNADRALFIAKRSGRNRVAVYPGTPGG
ncbi:MAG: GGDEF domain-containing protein [Acidobacteriota bacterium]|nr:GGDEF domain-containing protein [Acidobacteriota bacterium]